MKPFSLLLPLLIFFCVAGCENSGDADFIPLSDTTSVSGITGDSVKLVKTASSRFKVKNVEQATREISVISRIHGGMVVHQNFSSVETNQKQLKISSDSLLVVSTISPVSDMTVRVPSGQLEDFLFEAAALGYLTENTSMHIEDKTLSFLENQLKHDLRTEVLSIKPVPKANIDSRLMTIGVKDEAIDQQIANRRIDADARYSVVNLHLFQNPVVRKEVVANHYLSDYQLPFTTRFADAWQNGWSIFLNVLLFLIHLWAFLLTGLGILLIYRQRSMKKKITPSL